MSQKLYIFRPLFKERIWGGRELSAYKQMENVGDGIGESWELSGLSGDETCVEQGPYAGFTLTQLVECEREALVGKNVYKRFGSNFPLLVKFIDAEQDLSVQVHPNDELAQQRHGCCGKSEMWVVVNTQEGAHLLSGFNTEITVEEYEQRVANSTLHEVLNRYEVKPGDVFFLPSGRVHSIGAGCLICEIQQSCDITYRIYDHGRVDAQGRPRQLHIEEAREAIDFTPCKDVQVQPATLDCPLQTLVESPYFTTNRLHLENTMGIDVADVDSFIVYVCLHGKCLIQSEGEEVMLTAGHTVMLAADAEEVTIHPDTDCELLEVYINDKLNPNE